MSVTEEDERKMWMRSSVGRVLNCILFGYMLRASYCMLAVYAMSNIYDAGCVIMFVNSRMRTLTL